MNTFFLDPKLINFNNRFDVIFKYMFVKSIDKNFKTSFYEDSYKNHLKVWNNFIEYNNPSKNSYEAFKMHFLDLIQSIKLKGYNTRLDSIPVIGNNILNGSHRAATCLYYSREIMCRNMSNLNDGQIDCSWYFFKSLKRNDETIDSWASDQAALEYVELFNDVKIICVFPSAVKKGGIDQIRKALQESLGVFYEKEIIFNELGRVNLMKELYHKESWAESNNGAGYQEKANLCFDSNADVPVHFFITRMSLEQAVDCKNKIRQFYGIKKHSVHINDTSNEAKRIASAILNQNSVHFLNNAKPTKQFENFLYLFSKEIENNKTDYCITASMIMSAYGLREAKDIDYLFRENKLNTSNPLISSHNQYLQLHYQEHVDNIIFNPKNHFYCHGVKMISLEALKRMKKNRNEEKDVNDLKMIQAIL